ncbi:MAG: hypothetical protein RLZZ551_1252, partial [Actinomycetota bacterium]
FVHLKEVGNFSKEEIGGIREIAVVGITSIARGDAEHLGIGSLLVGHPEHANGPGPHVATRESGLGEQDESVEGVAVFAEGVGEKAIVEWVLGGREKRAVEPNGAGFMVHFIFVT